jgi:hypothetical protein
MNISNSGVGKYRTKPKKYDIPDFGINEQVRKVLNF